MCAGMDDVTREHGSIFVRGGINVLDWRTPS
jgi:hypothetical protein